MSNLEKQFRKVKEAHPDSLLMFRLGDFYEMFFEDALNAARELCLEVIVRGRSLPAEDRAPMCSIPVSGSEKSIERLIAAGYKVATLEEEQK